MTLHIVQPLYFDKEISIIWREILKMFRKTALVLSAALLLFASLSSCSGGSNLSFNAGTYTSVQEGKNGPVEVQVTFSDDAIKTIEIVNHSETPGLGTVPLERIPAQIIENQSLASDVVSGATMSSNAVINAVADAVTQAGGDPAALQGSAVAAKEVNTEELSADIVVVGAGAAGLSAALSATDMGADVIVLEKGINAGVSNGANAGGPIAVGTRVQEAEGENLTIETLFSHMAEYGNSTINDSLLKKALSATGDTLNRFGDLGMDIYLRRDSYGIGFRARHGFHSRGVDRASFLTNQIEANGGRIFYETAGESLIQAADGTITGINAVKSNGDRVVIVAKAVLLATGGYLGSEEKIHEKFGNINIIPLGNTLSVGDGIDMALAAGGREDKNWGIVANEFSAANKKAGSWSFNCNENLRFGIYGGLMVNMEGNRFFNEEIMANEPLAGAEASLRQKKYYAVMDSAYYDSVGSVGIFKTLGSPMEWKAGYLNLSDDAPNGIAHRKVLTKAAEELSEAVDQGWAFKADTIAELAEYFGLDNLEATVAEYNQMCDEGKDSLFYKSDYFLTPVKEGPFYVFEYEPSAWCTLGGVVVDDSLRVIDADFKPIPGLYAAGLDAGSMYTAPYYDNEGSAFGLALGSGTLAGRIMTEAVK